MPNMVWDRGKARERVVHVMQHFKLVSLVAALALLIGSVVAVLALERPEPILITVPGPTYTISQVQALIARQRRLSSGTVLRVRGRFVQLCSLPNKWGSSCLPPRFPGEPSYGLVDTTTTDNDRDLLRSLPLLLDAPGVLTPPRESRLSHLRTIFQYIPYLRRIIRPVYIGDSGNGLQIQGREIQVVVKVRFLQSCTATRSLKPCYVAEAVGLWA